MLDNRSYQLIEPLWFEEYEPHCISFVAPSLVLCDVSSLLYLYLFSIHSPRGGFTTTRGSETLLEFTQTRKINWNISMDINDTDTNISLVNRTPTICLSISCIYSLSIANCLMVRFLLEKSEPVARVLVLFFDADNKSINNSYSHSISTSIIRYYIDEYILQPLLWLILLIPLIASPGTLLLLPRLLLAFIPVVGILFDTCRSVDDYDFRRCLLFISAGDWLPWRGR